MLFLIFVISIVIIGFLVERLLRFLTLVGALGVGVVVSDIGAESALFPLLHLFLLPPTLDGFLPPILV